MTDEREIMDAISQLREDRDRAVGAVLLIAYEGWVSVGRAGELLGMTHAQIRAEFQRLSGEATT